MSDHVSKYLSYLLRLWCVDEDGSQVWRASLENPRTGERHGFACMDDLFGFLREKINEKDEREKFDLEK